MTKAALITLLCLASLASASRWETIKDCRLIKSEPNDGDSFHVEADGNERIFRLYFVDTPESEKGGLVSNRVEEQAEKFGIEAKEAVAIGKKAAAFTRSALSRPFKVTTRGQVAAGASKLIREYAFIETSDGEDLGELLIARGLARSFGKEASTPSQSAASLRKKYDRLEAKARREKIGAWKDSADGVSNSSPDNEEEDAEVAEENKTSPALPLPEDEQASEELTADITASTIENTAAMAGKDTPKADVASAMEPSAPIGKVSLNKATMEELETLPEIGPKTAEAIIAGRPYANVREVDRVEGIGPKTMEAILPLLTD